MSEFKENSMGSVGGEGKVQEYIARINAGEDKEGILQGLPPSFRGAIEAGLGTSDEGTESPRLDIIPPQYKGLNSVILEEIWTIPEYVDEEKTKAEKERKEAALTYLREQEQNASTSRTELESMKTKQAADDAEKISAVRKNLGLEQEPVQDLANVRICRETLEAKMQSPTGDKTAAYQRAIYEMITTRSEFAEMREEVGGDLVVLSERFRSELDEYRNELLPALEDSTKRQGMTWESNPGWMGINTRPETGDREGLNYKAYFTVPADEYSFVKHIPELAQRLRELAIDTDDRVLVKVPNGFMGVIRKTTGNPSGFCFLFLPY